jgi:O-antigen/teichoic acid export membrane protein
MAAAAANGLANYFLIPRLGGIGAGIATLVGYTLYFILVALRARTESLGLLARHWQVLVAAAVAGVLVRVNPVPSWRFARIVVSPVLAILLFVLIVTLLRHNEMRIVWRALNGRLTQRRRRAA